MTGVVDVSIVGACSDIAFRCKEVVARQTLFVGKLMRKEKFEFGREYSKAAEL